MTSSTSTLPDIFSNLPDEVKTWLSKHLDENPKLLIEYMGIGDNDIIKEFDREKNKDAETKNKELKIKEANHFKEDAIRKTNEFISQLAKERGFAQEDFEVEVNLRFKDEILRSVQNDNGKTRSTIKKEAIIQVPQNLLSGTYELETDFDRTIEALIEESKFDWKNDDINSKNFQTERKGRFKQIAYLINFNKNMTSEAVIQELDKLGLRPADIHELLAFSIKYPDIQRRFPILALASRLRRWRGGVRVSYLYGSASGRDLDLDLWSSGWHGGWRFFAFSK